MIKDMSSNCTVEVQTYLDHQDYGGVSEVYFEEGNYDTEIIKKHRTWFSILSCGVFDKFIPNGTNTLTRANIKAFENSLKESFPVLELKEYTLGIECDAMMLSSGNKLHRIQITWCLPPERLHRCVTQLISYILQAPIKNIKCDSYRCSQLCTQ